jgi:hypothetical protein
MVIALCIVLAALVALAALFAYAATRPPNFRTERSLRIDAPPQRIAPLIVDFHQWRLWSPWEDLDAGLKRHYEGSESGVGAAYAWEGRKAGVGRMEILDATPTRIRIKLDFVKPMMAHNTAEFTLTPAAGDSGGTDVNWAMFGPHPLLHRAMGVVFDMEKMVGREFTKGLQRMKSAAEQSPA